MTDLLFTLWVTSACNLRCKYCYEGVEKPIEFMTKETADEALNFISKTMQSKNMNDCRIVFHGGEPTLNMEIVEYVVNKMKTDFSRFNIQYGMTTNSYKLTDDTMKFLVENIDDLSVSLDGKEESHNRNRIDGSGEGSFDNALKNSLKMNEEKELRVRMTVNTSNSDQLYENIIFLIEQGFKVIVPGVDYGDKGWTEEHFERLIEQFVKIKEYLKNVKDNSIYVSSLSSEEISKKTICDGCGTSFHISPQGLLYPCVYTVGNSEYIFGNINSGVDYNIFRKYNDINQQVVEECKDCNFYDYCPTKRCKYINKQLTGEFNCPSPVVCAVENMLLKVSGVV